MWDVVLVDEVERWYLELSAGDVDLVTAAIDKLAEEGPTLGRPTVDSIKGSRVHNMKELRPGSIRILFVFDAQRRAVLLVAGDKAGDWNGWYRVNVPIAEQRYARWLAGDYDSEVE